VHPLPLNFYIDLMERTETKTGNGLSARCLLWQEALDGSPIHEFHRCMISASERRIHDLGVL
jgi:hypothetical protein